MFLENLLLRDFSVTVRSGIGTVLQTHTFTVVYLAPHILCLEFVYKLRATCGIELDLKRGYYLLNNQK